MRFFDRIISPSLRGGFIFVEEITSAMDWCELGFALFCSFLCNCCGTDRDRAARRILARSESISLFPAPSPGDLDSELLVPVTPRSRSEKSLSLLPFTTLELFPILPGSQFSASSSETSCSARCNGSSSSLSLATLRSAISRPFFVKQMHQHSLF